MTDASGPPDSASVVTPSDSTKGAPKPRGGAPRGNLNRLVHGRFSRRSRRALRDPARRGAEKLSREILVSMGMEQNPVARRVGMRLTDVETEVRRLRKFVETRGRFRKSGEPTAWYSRYLETIRQDLPEVRRLLDDVKVLGGGRDEGSVEHVVKLSDGRVLSPSVA